MKERPILFSAPMVRAILDGRKTQTRRIVKPQPFCPKAQITNFDGKWMVSGGYMNNRDWFNGTTREWKCKYGQPGDRLWVRETHRLWSHSFESIGVEYTAGGEDKIVAFQDRSKMPSLEVLCRRRKDYGRANRPSIFMPRWASRITLEITDVRVERLQDISQEDAAAEGVDFVNTGDFVTPYATLWESINGKGSWDANPWVWVIQFKRIT